MAAPVRLLKVMTSWESDAADSVICARPATPAWRVVARTPLLRQIAGVLLHGQQHMRLRNSPILSASMAHKTRRLASSCHQSLHIHASALSVSYFWTMQSQIPSEHTQQTC